MTRAPSAFAACSEATPTPDDTPVTSSHSPAFEPALQHQHVVDDEEGQRHAAAASIDRPGGIAHRFARVHQRVLGERAGAAAHHAAARGIPVTPAPTATTSPAPSMPAGFDAPGLDQAAGDELAAVQPRGVHPHAAPGPRPGSRQRRFGSSRGRACVAVDAQRIGLHRSSGALLRFGCTLVGRGRARNSAMASPVRRFGAGSPHRRAGAALDDEPSFHHRGEPLQPQKSS